MSRHRVVSVDAAVLRLQADGLQVTRLNHDLPSDVLRVAIGGHTVTRVPVRRGFVRAADVRRLIGGRHDR